MIYQGGVEPGETWGELEVKVLPFKMERSFKSKYCTETIAINHNVFILILNLINSLLVKKVLFVILDMFLLIRLTKMKALWFKWYFFKSHIFCLFLRIEILLPACKFFNWFWYSVFNQKENKYKTKVFVVMLMHFRN